MESRKDKYKRTLIDLAHSGKFIPGIYNYCDRWCERCTMTSKCLNYAHEQAMKEEATDPETNDINNEKFWESLRMSFQVTRELIEEDAKRLGIDLENLPEVEYKEPEKKQVEILAEKYSLKIHNWLSTNNKRLKQKTRQLLVISTTNKNALLFADAWEVVQWYSVFIAAKVHRAHFDLDERIDEEEDEFSPLSDNFGSAKIAIIAIDRSMEALSAMYSVMPEDEDHFLEFLAQLSKIKKIMLDTFPNVMEFKRPGFDE